MKKWKVVRRSWQVAILVALSLGAFNQVSRATLSNTSVQSVSALGNGATTSFTIGFPFQDNSNIHVYSEEESVSPPVRTEIQQGAGAAKFSITGGNPGTAITMGTAPTSTQKIIIIRQTPITQKVHYDPDSVFPAASHEGAMDKAYQILQEHDFSLNRKVGLSTASTATLPTMPDPAADRFLMFGHDGVSFSTLPVSGAPTVGDIPQFASTGWSTTQALGTLQNQFGAHISNLSNPHQVTAAQVGNTTAQWNANKIQGKTVDASAIADQKALVYASGADTIGYATIPGLTSSPNFVGAYNSSGVYTPVVGIDATNQIASGTLSIARGGLGTPVTGASTGVVEFASGLATVRTLVDGDISASAAIQRGKLATGKTTNALLNDSSGNIATVPALPTSVGGTGVAAAGVIYPIAGTVGGMTPNNHGVLVSGSASTVTVIAPDASTSKVLTSGGSGADPTWSAVSAPAATVQTKNLPYTILNTDGVIETTNVGNSINITFPDATVNQGLILRVDQKGNLAAGQSTLLVAVSGQLFNSGGPTNQGLSTFPLLRKNEGIEALSDGSNWRILNHRTKVSMDRMEWSNMGNAAVCAASPCNITDSSAGISSITRASTGVYTVNFSPSWSRVPTCFVNQDTGAGNITVVTITSNTVSTASVNGYISNTGGTASDTAFDVLCIGAN